MANFYGCLCPNCGAPLSLPQQSRWGMGPMWQQPGFGPMGTLPGTYLPAYGGGGIASDDDIKDMVLTSFDADPRIPYDSDITVDVTGGIVTLTGTVPNKRIKHAAGDDAWWIPDVVDVNNELEVLGRRESASSARRLRK